MQGICISHSGSEAGNMGQVNQRI